LKISLTNYRGWLIFGNILSFLVVIAGVGFIVYLALNSLPSEAEIGDRSFGFLMWVTLIFSLPIIGIIASIPTGMALVNLLDNQLEIIVGRYEEVSN
jgi:hypothetical protein